MRITLGGTPVSGKGTAGKLLAKELKYDYWSIGNLFREEATRRGLTFPQFHALLEREPTLDYELDTRQSALSNRDDIIIDSRLGFHFVRDTVKVFLTVNLDVAAARLFAAKRSEEEFSSVAEARADIERRMNTDRERYLKLYDVDIMDTSNYDVVIDTTPLDPKAVVEAIKKQLPRKV